MNELEKIILERNKRLDKIPIAFETSVQAYQRTLFEEILSLLDKLKRDSSGNIIFNTKDVSNLRLIAQINEDLKATLLGGDYVKAVNAFAQQFDKQAELADEFFDKAFPNFKPSMTTAADAVLLQTKTSALELLIGEPLDSNLLIPIKSILEDAVSSGAKWMDTVKSIRDFVEGNDKADGRLLQYAKQIAYDEFAISDRTYVNAVSEELDTEFYFYSGQELPSTRCFCHERKGRYFHYKEIQSWGRGENLGDCELADGGWAGMKKGTNENTIFNYAGGHRCNDTIMPVSVFGVPIAEVRRAIERGYYSPTDKERELLGL